MRKYHQLQTNEPVEDRKNIINISRKNILYHPLNFLAHEYQNDPEVLLKRLTGILAIGATGNLIKSRRIKSIIKIAQYGLTVGLFGSELYSKLNNYIRNIRPDDDDLYRKRMIKISELLNISEDDPVYGDVPHCPSELNSSIALWFLHSPSTTRLKILKYVDFIKMEEIESVDTDEVKQVSAIFQYNGETYIWDMSIVAGPLGNTYINASFILGKSLNSEIHATIRESIIFDYVNSLNYKNNIIKFGQSEGEGVLLGEPRRKIAEHLNQFDADKFLDEIRFVLKSGRKRTYAFVGRQGTGKSSILRYIEQHLTEYMVFYMTPDDFSSASMIRNKFFLIRMFQPLVVMIEDLEACGMREKNSKTGAFLDCIDDVNKNLNMVIIYTVNDTSGVHHTIINRPGRSDRVIEIFPPDSAEEAYEVMESRLMAVKENYCNTDIVIENRAPVLNIMEKCVREKFTQAEITNAVVEQALIEIGMNNLEGTIKEEVFAKYLERAIEVHLETRRAIRECNFHNLDPDDLVEEGETLHKYEEHPKYGAQ